MVREDLKSHIFKGVGKNTDLMSLIRQAKVLPVKENTKEVMPDRTIVDDGYWERATFTVPDDIPHERVVAASQKYKERFGKALTLQGFKIKEMLEPVVSDRLPEEGRRRYDIMAFVSRKPMTLHMEIPDEIVPEMEAKGMKLNE